MPTVAQIAPTSRRTARMSSRRGVLAMASALAQYTQCVPMQPRTLPGPRHPRTFFNGLADFLTGVYPDRMEARAAGENAAIRLNFSG
jgi:hypothetical protein